MTQPELLRKVTRETQSSIERTRRDFLQASEDDLLRKPAPKSWSAAECFVHMLKANKFYLDNIETAFAAELPPPQENFSSGRVGKLFLSFVEPQADGGRPKQKVPAPGAIQPSSDVEDPKAVIEKFLAQQERFLGLVKQAETADLKKVRVKSLLGNIVRFRLGDALQLVSWHSIRHLDQATRAVLLPAN